MAILLAENGVSPNLSLPPMGTFGSLRQGSSPCLSRLDPLGPWRPFAAATPAYLKGRLLVEQILLHKWKAGETSNLVKQHGKAVPEDNK